MQQASLETRSTVSIGSPMRRLNVLLFGLARRCLFRFPAVVMKMRWRAR